jgi:hypothetical protein
MKEAISNSTCNFVLSFREILYTHQKQCEKSGKYVEADFAKKRLAKMRTDLEKHKRDEMLVKHEE